MAAVAAGSGGIKSIIENPWVIGGAGVLFIVLLLARGSGSSSSGLSEPDAASLDALSLNTQGNTALAQINAPVQEAAIAAGAQDYQVGASLAAVQTQATTAQNNGLIAGVFSMKQEWSFPTRSD